jgi:hypothetical protein
MTIGKINLIQIILLTLYEIGLFIFAGQDFLLVLAAIFWLPTCLILFVYGPLLDKLNIGVSAYPTNKKSYIEFFIMMSTFTPVIGPLIAILRIRYLQNEIKRIKSSK